MKLAIATLLSLGLLCLPGGPASGACGETAAAPCTACDCAQLQCCGGAPSAPATPAAPASSVTVQQWLADFFATAAWMNAPAGWTNPVPTPASAIFAASSVPLYQRNCSLLI